MLSSVCSRTFYDNFHGKLFQRCFLFFPRAALHETNLCVPRSDRFDRYRLFKIAAALWPLGRCFRRGNRMHNTHSYNPWLSGNCICPRITRSTTCRNPKRVRLSDVKFNLRWPVQVRSKQVTTCSLLSRSMPKFFLPLRRAAVCKQSMEPRPGNLTRLSFTFDSEFQDEGRCIA
jgi:hypothetical protein